MIIPIIVIVIIIVIIIIVIWILIMSIIGIILIARHFKWSNLGWFGGTPMTPENLLIYIYIHISLFLVYI